jgi:hypothetical protein
MVIPLSIMSDDMDWYNWNEKFMQSILQIVNSERVKSSRRMWTQKAKSHDLISNTIGEIRTESEQCVGTPNEIYRAKVSSVASEGRMK